MSNVELSEQIAISKLNSYTSSRMLAEHADGQRPLQLPLQACGLVQYASHL